MPNCKNVLERNIKIQTIDSKEVAEMMGKEHKQLLREIRTHIQVLTSENLSPVEFFEASSYLDNKGEERPCFAITKMGCEMLGNKRYKKLSAENSKQKEVKIGMRIFRYIISFFLK